MNPPPLQLKRPLWQYLASPDGRQLLKAAVTVDPHDAAALTHLRKTWSLDQIAAAMNLIEARTRAASKFDDPQRLMADSEGVQQATGTAVARHKASRFADLEHVADLCCGIGGDTMELAQVTNVIGIDIDPARVWMAEQNAQCSAREADVTDSSAQDILKQVDAWHIDPSRRSQGKRLWHYADLIPSPATITSLVQVLPNAAIKLGPGINFDELPVAAEDEVEVIGDGSRLYEATWWRGDLTRHPGQRTATNLVASVSISGVPQPATVRAQPGFDDLLFEADPALERADLVGCLPESEDLYEATPGLGLLTGTTPIDSPWLHCYQVIHQMPWRIDKVRRWLDKHNRTISAVRTRGKAVDPDEVWAALPKGNEDALVLFVLRLGKKCIAVLTTPAAML